MDRNDQLRQWIAEEKKLLAQWLAEQAEIEQQYQELLKWREQEKDMTARRKVNAELIQGIAELEKVIYRLESDLRVEINVLTAQMNEERLKASEKPDYEKERENYVREYNRFKKLQEQFLQIRDEGVQAKAELEMLRRQSDSETAQFIAEKETALAELRTKYSELDKELKLFPNIQRQLVTIDFLLAESRSAEKNSLELRERLDKLYAKLNNQSFAKREWQAIGDLKQKLDDNGYHETEHELLRSKIAEHAAVEGKKIFLDRMRERFHRLTLMEKEIGG